MMNIDWGAFFLTLLFDLMITVCGYLLVPTILALSHKSRTMSQINRIVIINGIVVWLVFQILIISFTGEASKSGAVILWSFVAHWMLKKCCLSEDDENEAKTTRHLGKKWFVFYTKVRPWIGCIFSLALIVDFVRFPNAYLGNWFLWFFFLIGVAQSVLSITVFVKSFGDYDDFVYFVKGVLIFETVSISCQIGLQQSARESLKTPYAIGYVWGYFLAIVAFSLLILYFLWYRLNIRYFEKRIMVEEAEILNYNFASQHRPPQISAHNELPKKYGNYYTPLSDLQLQTEDKKKMPNTISSTTPKARFCRNCGNKLWADDRFCDQCGTKVISKKN